MIYLQIFSRNSSIAISNGQRGIIHTMLYYSGNMKYFLQVIFRLYDIESKLPKNFFLYATLSLYAVSVSHQYVINTILINIKIKQYDLNCSKVVIDAIDMPLSLLFDRNILLYFLVLGSE